MTKSTAEPSAALSLAPPDQVFASALQNHQAVLKPVETGTVASVYRGVARVQGLPSVGLEEILQIGKTATAIALNLDSSGIGVVILDGQETVRTGDEVRRTGRLLDVPVADSLLGRVIDPLGRPQDRLGVIRGTDRRVCEQSAAAVLDRSPVTVPLQTGIKVIDALVPIGRGQRELIVGDRQTGKTALAVDTILNQRDSGVICIYCAIGQRTSSVASVIAELRQREALSYSVVVVAEGNSSPGLQFAAPFAATAIGEHFMLQGRDVLVVYDDLTAHAEAYRELSLLLRRPPGREAFPGDIFYLHSRLLERATHLNSDRGGGSLTALPIARTTAQNLAAYIPTNLISITDGQICLSPQLFQKGVLPAVDVGRSVSRVGGRTQLPVYRAVTGELRLAYSQFEELEAFSRFSSRLDQQTKATLERGRRVREILKQPQFQTQTLPAQIAALLAVTTGLLDALPLSEIAAAEARLSDRLISDLPQLCQQMSAGQPLTEDDHQQLQMCFRKALDAAPDGKSRHADA